ncbi:GRIP and coiled-coil domain-containing protein 2-like isoform X2 [Anopheles albimanus]|uniref:GRIP and coiled-coil domain-containing protein 2-like isoform X2 n=1 Tax=Anopheles albimanus TaxID=7167 RepID=UPI001640B314|nr:GRIP and coiled-coil domain-containing protein 2-like isoform X2 [Anopheles albimanus]
MSQNSDQDPAAARKPSPFDNLSRDELVKKCKGLLGIAQKAKQAKDECQEENRRLKEQLDHYETQKNADKECIKAMQEVADSYMDQKLMATMRVDELEKQLAKTAAQLSSDQASHEQMKQQLMAELDDLRQKLELSKKQDASSSKNDVLAERLKELEEENTKLEQDLIRAKASQPLKTEPNGREEKLIRKLKLYKAKVQEINAKLLLLKSDRKILLKTVKDYAEQVPKWQKELANASGVLFEKISTLEREKDELSGMNSSLREDNEALQRQLKALKLEAETTNATDQTDNKLAETESLLEALRSEVEHLKSGNVTLTTENQRLLSETESKQRLDCEEKENLRKDLEASKVVINSLEEKLNVQSSSLSDTHQANEELSERIAENLKIVESLQMENQTLGKQLTTLTEQLRNQSEALQSERESHEREMVCLKQELENNEKERNELSQKLQSTVGMEQEKNGELLTRFQETSAKLLANEQQNEQHVREIAALKATNESQAARFAEETVSRETMARKLDENQQVVQKLIVENQNLEAQLGQLAEKLKGSVEKLKQANAKAEQLEGELSSCQKQLEQQTAESQRLLDEVKQAEAIAAENVDKHTLLKTENGELLTELKELNEILKARGEVINLQLSKIAELQEKLSHVESTDMKLKIEQLQQSVAEKESELERQREELATMKDRPNISFDAQSDVMSISTISRVEDVARMRELDEGFEEKYIKLRSLAVKLKKKVAEQAVLLQKYEQESSSSKVPAAEESTTSLATASKNIQTLQAENDRLQDELEGVRKEAEQLRVELQSKTTELATMQQVQKDVEGTKVDRGTLETTVREYQMQIQNLKREKDAFQLAKREIDAENQRLKAGLKSKEKELVDEQERQKELRMELDRSKLAVKKANVLSLEMEAYERSLTELNSKLEAKKTLVKELEGTIDTQAVTIKSLKQQLVVLEESLESQQQHSRELKQEVDVQQGKLRHSEHKRLELMNQLEELRDEHDQAKQRVENNRVELEQVAAEKEKVCGTLEQEKTNLQKQTLALESELVELRKELAERQQEVEDVRTEFASYKIRAQSVLRQNQNKDSSREKELEEELSQAQTSLEMIEGKQQQLVRQVAELSKSNEELKSEKERTQHRCKELLSLLEEARLQHETLLEESRKSSLEQQEALKTQRIQNETLIQCYKKQLEELRESHGREMEQLQTTLRLRVEADGVNAGRGLLNNNLPVPGLTTLPATAGAAARVATFTDEQRINMLLMEREDGEGSESTNQNTAAGVHTLRRKLSTASNSRGTRNRDIIPLEDLLNNSFDDSASVEMALDGADGDQSLHGSLFGGGRGPSPTVELQQTKEQLSKQESRVRHLTAVLAEAEQDLAKLTQLNELLKEEVRRQQRSIEREAHVHNSEYLKNVIFKFITLNNGDERSRLVPVLNTILKLSPDETQKLQNVAKGSDTASRGWTGLLWNS